MRVGLSLPRPPTLIRQAGIYTVSRLVNAAVPFLLLPVLTRFLTPGDYGIVAMFLFLTVILEPFIGLGLPAAASVKYFDDATDTAPFIGSGFAAVAALALVALSLLLVLQAPISAITQVPTGWLLLAVPLVVFRVVGAVMLTSLQVRGRALPYAISQTILALGILAGSVALVVGQQLDWRGRLAAEVMAWTAFAALALLSLRRLGWLRFAASAAHLRELARFGLPLIPHVLGSVLILQADRLLLTNLVGVDEVGLYTVGVQLAVVIELVALSFNNAFAPWLYQRLTSATDEVRSQLVRYTYRYMLAIAAFAVGIAFAAPNLAGFVLGPDFERSGAYVPWFAVGFFFSAMYYMVTNYIFFARQTRWLAAVTVTTAVIHIPLAYLLIKINGGIGAAQATAISLGLSLVLTWIVSHRVYPMPWLRGGSAAA